MAHYPGCFGSKITKSSALLDHEQHRLRKKRPKDRTHQQAPDPHPSAQPAERLIWAIRCLKKAFCTRRGPGRCGGREFVWAGIIVNILVFHDHADKDLTSAQFVRMKVSPGDSSSAVSSLHSSRSLRRESGSPASYAWPVVVRDWRRVLAVSEAMVR